MPQGKVVQEIRYQQVLNFAGKRHGFAPQSEGIGYARHLLVEILFHRSHREDVAERLFRMCGHRVRSPLQILHVKRQKAEHQLFYFPLVLLVVVFYSRFRIVKTCRAVAVGFLQSLDVAVQHGQELYRVQLLALEADADCTAPQKLDTFGVFFMKYNYEIRLKAVKLVLEGGLSVREAGCHLGCGRSQVHLWVTLFERHGLTGLKLRHGSYSAEFKLSVLKHMHQNHLSLLETAVHFGIPGPFVIRQWERLYQNQGAEGLRRKPQRRRPAMSKSKTKKVKLKTTPHEELLKELEYLRAENAYLKKLQALVEERIVRESGKEPKPSKD